MTLNHQNTMKKDTILRSLTIERNQSYEANPGQYKGKVKYECGGSSIDICLDESVSQRLLAFLGPVLVQASAGLANQITGCLEQSLEASRQPKAIEAQSSTEQAPEEAH